MFTLFPALSCVDFGVVFWNHDIYVEQLITVSSPVNTQTHSQRHGTTCVVSPGVAVWSEPRTNAGSRVYQLAKTLRDFS